MQPGMKTRNARRSLPVGVAIAALAVVTGFAAASYAQGGVRARVDVAFGFVAAEKDMPAGTYEFSVEPGRVVLRSLKDTKVPTTTMTVVTRLGRHDADPDTRLIFDKIDGKSVLSELWFPGSDGYLVAHSTKEHKHQVVGGSRPLK
ncbi:MAG TPA: hypothetical protein VK911_09075 [Vicinamibacterales bacterium]|nr:hypothetical protein [Vicinamibacterales bacterium]